MRALVLVAVVLGAAARAQPAAAVPEGDAEILDKVVLPAVVLVLLLLLIGFASAAIPDDLSKVVHVYSNASGLSTDLLETVLLDRTEGAVARRLDAGISLMSLSRGPALRVDWEKRTDPESDHLKGQVTYQERIWGVIVTMGIAGMRDQVFLDGDVTWYVLIFFCFYDAVMASIMYSTRFNDTDIFHRFFWALYTMGMVCQCAFLNKGDFSGFAVGTGFLYFLIGTAQLRVAAGLPRARFLALHDAFWNLAGAGIFAVSIWRTELFGPEEDHLGLLLAAHALIRPASFLTFWWFTRTAETKKRRDVPVNIWYMISRFEGLYMMIIVCSVLFPLGLAGVQFVTSGVAATEVLFANVYALLLKLSLMDVTHHEDPENLEFHAIRYGSRARALVFLLVFPYGVLGIALTGVGLVSVPRGAAEGLSRLLLSGGACLTWAMVTLAEACHGDRAPRVHFLKIAGQFVGAALFLLPWYCELTAFSSVLYLVVEMAVILAFRLALEYAKAGSLPSGWRWRRPQLFVPGVSLAVGGDKVSSQEHFFTVLLAAAVLKLNIDLGSTEDVFSYVMRLATFYYIIWSTIRYAARFKDEDLSHKIIWSIFEVALLVMLEGLSATGTPSQDALFSGACAAMFLVLAVLFSGRAAWAVPEARVPSGFYVRCHIMCAACFAACCFVDRGRRVLQFTAVVILFTSDVFFTVAYRNMEDWNVSINRQYLVTRIDGLLMEVLGVAVLVPNAIYPRAYEHPVLVAAGDAVAVKLAISFKAAIFDVEPVRSRHAINRDPWRRLFFGKATCFTILSLALFGAGIPLTIVSTGQGGLRSRDFFSQALTCSAAAIFWASLTLTKFLHRHRSNLRVHRTKAFVQALGSLLSFLPLATAMSDLSCLCTVMAVAQVVEWTQYWLCCGCLG